MFKNIKMGKLYITYATDENYIQHVTVSIKSLIKVAKDIAQYEVYLLVNNLAESTIAELRNFSDKNHLSLYIIRADNLKEILPENINWGGLSITTYFRLFLAELLPTFIDKVLYLDCDTVIMQDLSSLAEYPMGDCSVCGVEDTMYPAIKKMTGLSSDGSYLNAGVLLVNLKKWRESNIVKSFLDFINRFDGKVPHLDQGVINGVIPNHGILPLAYNVQSPIYVIHKYDDLLKFFFMNTYYSLEEFLQARSNPIILHYTSFFAERPWFRFCLHPKKTIYRDLLQETPFAKASFQRNQYGWGRKFKMLLFNYLQPIYLALKFSKDKMTRLKSLKKWY